MPATNPKNVTTNIAASDLGLSAGVSVDPAALDADNERKKKLLQQQREQMGQDGSSVYGNAAMTLFSGLGNG